MNNKPKSEQPSLNRRLFRNARTIFEFEIMIKLMTIVFAIPLFSGMERLIMTLTGYQYLSAENLGAFFRHPLFIACFVLFIFLLSLLGLADIAAVTFNLHNSMYDKKTDVFHTALFVARQIQSVLASPGHWGLLLIVLLMIPFLCLGLIPAFVSNLIVKDIILKKLSRRTDLLIAAGLILGILICFFLQAMFACTISLLEKKDYKAALPLSRGLGRKRHLRDLMIYLGTQLLCYLSYALLLGIAMLLAVLFERVLSPMRLVNPISTSLLLTISNVTFCLSASATIPASCICITSLYYVHKAERSEPIPGIDAVDCVTFSPFLHRYSNLKAIITQCVVAFCIIICSIYIYLTYKGRLNPNIEYVHQTEITAHRGASRYFPENTMAAVKGAMDQGADWIELDIHQSKDGVLFVMHDDSLFRTCGVHGKCWDFTWNELSRMDAAKFFKARPVREPIPLLSEVIDFAILNDLRLNIELKPSRYEPEMEKKLVEMLEEKDFIHKCVVTSQKYESIYKIKTYNPDITTVYVMGYAYGHVEKLVAADHFSINMSSVSRSLVSRIHNAGKQVFVWTVNSRTYIEDMIEKNVDNIITNDVLLAKKIVGEMRTSTALYEYIKLLHRLFSFG